LQSQLAWWQILLLTVIKPKKLGETAANAITRRVFSEVKLKCSDKVTTINGANTIKVRGQTAPVNPTLLFNRITCVLKNSTEIEEYLTYELLPQPSALFHDSTMRKTRVLSDCY